MHVKLILTALPSSLSPSPVLLAGSAKRDPPSAPPVPLAAVALATRPPPALTAAMPSRELESAASAPRGLPAPSHT